LDYKKELQVLYHQIMKLETSFDILSDNFLMQSKKLKDPGIPPGLNYIKKITNIRRKYKLIVRKIFLMSKALYPAGNNKKPSSLSEVKDLWHFLYNKLYPQSEKQNNLYPKPEKQSRAGANAEAESLKEQKKLAQDIFTEADSQSAAIEAVTQDVAAETVAQNVATKSTIQSAATKAAFQGITTEAVPQSADKALPDPAGSGLTKESNNKEAPEKLFGMIYSLIRDAKYGPAFWLSSYCEQVFGRAPVPPWLIRAMEIAVVIRGEGGPAAKWLAYLYKNHDFEALYPGKPVAPAPEVANKVGLGLLAFSALLRPSLLAPGCGALSMLGKLTELPEGLGKLVTAIQSCRLPGGNGIQSGMQEDMRILSDEVKSWYKQNKKLSLASPAASKVWKYALNEGGFVYEILNPIQENNREALEHIRKLCDTLKDKENLKNEIKKLFITHRAPAGEMKASHIPGLLQMINRTKGALKLAERWIKLLEKEEKNNDGKSLTLAFQEPLQLARVELYKIAAQFKGNLLVEAGLAATHRAFDSLEELTLDGMPEPISAEDSARLEANSNPQLLLKIPWKPKEATVKSMGKALLHLLEEQLPQRNAADTGDAGELPSSGLSEQRESFAAVNSNPGELNKNNILTLQEREFIKKTLRTFNY
jgi:hypothetical protein